ncbi:MAG: hypothetical protein NTW58_09490 [Actinobacteria bacterium]|nr:hypothetical protein [Actinomycetota bacterium]
MTIDEAIRDLLNVSTDIQGVAVLGPEGDIAAAGPGVVAADLGVTAARLWEAAVARAAAFGESLLDHVVVQDANGAVAMLAARGRRIAAVTGPRPAVGLLLFDLRTCLGDAFAEEEGQ